MSAEPPNSLPVIRLKFDAVSAAAARFPGADVSSIETCLQLLSVMSEMFGAFDLHYARHGLSRGRFIVLVMLAGENGGGLSPAELADRAKVTRATMTGLIDTLAQGGYVERVDDPLDRRMYRVFMTDKGRELLNGMLPDHFNRITGLMRHLGPDEQQQFRRLLEKIQSGIDAVRNE